MFFIFYQRSYKYVCKLFYKYVAFNINDEYYYDNLSILNRNITFILIVPIKKKIKNIDKNNIFLLL